VKELLYLEAALTKLFATFSRRLCNQVKRRGVEASGAPGKRRKPTANE